MAGLPVPTLGCRPSNVGRIQTLVLRLLVCHTQSCLCRSGHRVGFVLYELVTVSYLDFDALISSFGKW